MTNEPNGSCPWCGGTDRDTRPQDDAGVRCTNTWHTTREQRAAPNQPSGEQREGAHPTLPMPPVEAEIRRRLAEEQPELPYGGDTDPNSGFTGSSTSEAMVRDADSSGVTAHRQQQALEALDQAGGRGLTWRELATALELHHGSASSVLSTLHKAGRIDRLAETRNRCKVYVLPLFTAGREIETHGRTAATGLLKEAIEVLRAHGECTFHRLSYPESDCLACRGAEVVAAYDRRNMNESTQPSR